MSCDDPVLCCHGNRPTLIRSRRRRASGDTLTGCPSWESLRGTEASSGQGPVSLRQYELVYHILARKQELLYLFRHSLKEFTKDLNS